MPGISEELRWRGVLGRSGFWGRHLLVLPFALAACIAVRECFGEPWDLLPVLLTVAFVASVWARRLHDRGRSAAWLLLVLVPCMGALVLIIECGLRASVAARADEADYKTV